MLQCKSDFNGFSEDDVRKKRRSYDANSSVSHFQPMFLKGLGLIMQESNATKSTPGQTSISLPVTPDPVAASVGGVGCRGLCACVLVVVVGGLFTEYPQLVIYDDVFSRS